MSISSCTVRELIRDGEEETGILECWNFALCLQGNRTWCRTITGLPRTDLSKPFFTSSFIKSDTWMHLPTCSLIRCSPPGRAQQCQDGCTLVIEAELTDAKEEWRTTHTVSMAISQVKAEHPSEDVLCGVKVPVWHDCSRVVHWWQKMGIRP